MYSDGANCISAAEHTLALILEIYKKIKYSDSLIRRGKFADTNFERRELSGKTIGIIGVGKVGSYVVKLAKAFGIKVIANDIDIKVRRKYKNLIFRNLENICKNCDIISLHIPLNNFNNNFISKNKLGLLQKDSILINTSRGKILDENYLIRLLEKKKIKYAGLDVFNSEPNINNRFFGLNNVVLTNHIAGKTIESKSKMSEEIILKIKNFYLKY